MGKFVQPIGRPMVLLDQRRGSGELFQALSKKIDTELTMLPAGDMAFEGYVEDGRDLIGIERKRISDALDCLCTGRFSGLQLIEMSKLYRISYLVIEGLWRANKDTGFLETWQRDGWQMARKGSRAFKYDDFDHHLTTLMNMTPIKVCRTSTSDETVQFIVSKYTWHNDKAWNKHTSHLAIYKGPGPGDRVPLSFRKPPLRRVVAHDMPGVAWERALAAQETFQTTHQMINATIKEWCKVDGIGLGIAEKIYNKVRTE